MSASLLWSPWRYFDVCLLRALVSNVAPHALRQPFQVVLLFLQVHYRCWMVSACVIVLMVIVVRAVLLCCIPLVLAQMVILVVFVVCMRECSVVLCVSYARSSPVMLLGPINACVAWL